MTTSGEQEPLKYTKTVKWHAAYNFKSKNYDDPFYQRGILIISLLTFLGYCTFRQENSLDDRLYRRSLEQDEKGQIKFVKT